MFTSRIEGMNDSKEKTNAVRMLFAVASAIVLIAGLKFGQDFFIPIVLAAFIATVSFPITNWLRKHKVPRFFAVLLTVLVDFAFLIGIVLICISLVGDLETKWNETYYNALTQRIDEASEGAVAVLEKFEVADARSKVEAYGPSNIQEQLTNNFSLSKVLNVGTDVAWKVVSFFGSVFLVLILTVFMLSEARMFGRRADAILEARGPNFQRFLSATSDIQRYLAIKTLVSLATGVLAGFLCWAAHLDFFLLWAILAFALNFIPVLGSIIAGVPPFFLALLVHGGPSGVAIAVGFVSINLFLGNFLEPMLMGRRFGLSTLVVIISVLFWGYIWGPVGMLLGVPLTMVLKVMLDNSDDLRWLSVAITKEKRRPMLVPEDDEDSEIDSSLLDGDMGLADRFSESTRS
ncbi:MAG: AI-2E family transporter [Akkermansiaceae bacterium]